MLFKRVSRDSAEVAYVVVKNVSGGTLTAGYSCVWDISAPDGVRVSQAATATLSSFAGVADADIANNAYGKVQVYGYRPSAYIYSSTGSSAAGDVLGTVNAEWGLTPSAAATTTVGWGFLCEAVAASSSSRFHTTAKVFIRGI